MINFDNVIPAEAMSWGESNQTISIRYSLGILDESENKIKAIFYPTSCRDNFHNFASAFITGYPLYYRDASYLQTYNDNVRSYDFTKKLYLILQYRNAKHMYNFLKNESALLELENRLVNIMGNNIQKSLYKAQTELYNGKLSIFDEISVINTSMYKDSCSGYINHCVVLDIGRIWMLSPLMLSTLTLVVRLMSYNWPSYILKQKKPIEAAIHWLVSRNVKNTDSAFMFRWPTKTRYSPEKDNFEIDKEIGQVRCSAKVLLSPIIIFKHFDKILGSEPISGLLDSVMNEVEEKKLDGDRVQFTDISSKLTNNLKFFKKIGYWGILLSNSNVLTSTGTYSTVCGGMETSRHFINEGNGPDNVENKKPAQYAKRFAGVGIIWKRNIYYLMIREIRRKYREGIEKGKIDLYKDFCIDFIDEDIVEAFNARTKKYLR